MSAITPQILITDLSKGTSVLRDMTTDETAELNAQRAEANAQAETREQDLTARAAARQAVLDKLGLTADEAAALLG